MPMEPPETGIGKFLIRTFAGALLVGLALYGIGSAVDVAWVRYLGYLSLALAGVVMLLPLPVFAYVYPVILVWIALLPLWIAILLLRPLFGPLRRLFEIAHTRAERRAGPAVPVGEQYRIFVARQARVANRDDLVPPVARLVDRLQRVGGRTLALYYQAGTLDRQKVTRFGANRVASCFLSAGIPSSHGRDPADPSHELIFLTRFQGTVAVSLRIAFVLQSEEATCPGLVAEVRLTPAAAGRDAAQRTARLEQVFAILAETLEPDYGHLELPGEPPAENWPAVPGRGWLTYASGALVRASAGPVPDRYNEPAPTA